MSFTKRLSTLFILLLAFNQQALASVQASASVSNTQVFLGDIFILTVEVNDTGSKYQLNTSSLTDDFTVYRPSRSEQTSIINGDYTATTTWSVRLQAKQIGDFTIPSLKVGNAATQAIRINVKQPGKQQQSSMGEAIFIENHVDKNKVYLDQPILLTSRIYIAESANINGGDIQPPQLAGAEIERTDKEDQSQLVRNGMRYRIFTYQYQISPTLAGEDTITSPLLVGNVRKSVRINNWKNKIIAEPINVRGNNIDIQVKAIPDSFKGDWLVSEDVRLLENNDLQAQQFKVGEPITRSISLQIASLPMDKMPEIKLSYPNNMRYYPDQDELTQGTVGDVLYSQRTITHAVIANKSGSLILPKITIPWWNSVTEQQEYATLPAQILTILPADNASSEQLTPAATQNNLIPNSNTQNTASISTTVDNSGQLLLWQTISFILLLICIALAIYHYRYTQRQSQAESNVIPPANSTNTYHALLTAIDTEQPQQVYACLLRYLQHQNDGITQIQQVLSFSALDKESKEQLQNNLEQLELACARRTHQWDAKILLSLIKLHHKKSEQTRINAINTINP